MDSRQFGIARSNLCIESLTELKDSIDIMMSHIDKKYGFTAQNLSTLSITQIIDIFMQLTQYGPDYSYLVAHPNTMSQDGYDSFRNVNLSLLKNNYAQKHFNQSYNEHYAQLNDDWQTALQNGFNNEIFTALDKQRDFLQDFYADCFNARSLNYSHLLFQLYEQDFIEYHYYFLQLFNKNYSAFLKRTQAEKKLHFNSHLFIGMMQEKRLSLYQALIDKIFNHNFNHKITCYYHSTSHLIHKKNENTYHIAIADTLPFSDELDLVLSYIGEIFYNLTLKQKESPIHLICNTSYAKEQMIAFFQFLPLGCPSFAKFITKTALKIEQISPNEELIDFYQDELLMYYLSFHKNPLRQQLVNPLQKINLLYCEALSEKLWFTQAIKSAELPEYWEKISLKKLKKAPSHPIEGTLRMESWKDTTIGHSLIKLISIVNLFRDELTSDGLSPFFANFTEYFEQDCLHLWNYHQLIDKQLSKNINPAQNTLNYIGKFYNTYIYQRPLLKDNY